MCQLTGMGICIFTVRAASGTQCTFRKTFLKNENAISKPMSSLPVIPFQTPPEAAIPSGLVTPGAEMALYGFGFDFVSENREQLTFVQQYDSRREETVRNMRITLERGASIDDVRDAIYDAGWCAHKEHVTRARDAYLTALKAPPEIRQIGPLPSQYGPNILAATMPAKA
jgi:hypothetical protein